MPSSPPLTPLATAALHVGTPERILQVQCGSGDGALFLAREFPAARVRGVDAEERAIREATGRIGLDPEGRIAFKVGGPRALPYPDDLFDLLAVLDRRVPVGEASRVLRPGGHLIVAHSVRSRAPAGARARLLRWRLRRRGFVAVEAAAAGEGSFTVDRLGGLAQPRPGH